MSRALTQRMRGERGRREEGEQVGRGSGKENGRRGVQGRRGGRREEGCVRCAGGRAGGQGGRRGVGGDSPPSCGEGVTGGAIAPALCTQRGGQSRRALVGSPPASGIGTRRLEGGWCQDGQESHMGSHAEHARQRAVGARGALGAEGRPPIGGAFLFWPSDRCETEAPWEVGRVGLRAESDRFKK